MRIGAQRRVGRGRAGRVELVHAVAIAVLRAAGRPHLADRVVEAHYPLTQTRIGVPRAVGHIVALALPLLSRLVPERGKPIVRNKTLLSGVIFDRQRAPARKPARHPLAGPALAVDRLPVGRALIALPVAAVVDRQQAVLQPVAGGVAPVAQLGIPAPRHEMALHARHQMLVAVVVGGPADRDRMIQAKLDRIQDRSAPQTFPVRARVTPVARVVRKVDQPLAGGVGDVSGVDLALADLARPAVAQPFLRPAGAGKKRQAGQGRGARRQAAGGGVN